MLANLMHETGNFSWIKELADGTAYEYRTDLGNVNPGDGPKFKGTGVLQLTGRYNYTKIPRLRDPKVVELGVDYVADKYPFPQQFSGFKTTICLMFALTKDLMTVAIESTVVGMVTKTVKLSIK